MRYLDRKEFLYDPLVFKRSDTVTALGIHAEYVLKHSATPWPKFFEVDRSEQQIDPLWHMPMTERTTFSRTLLLPAITTFDKAKWKIRKQGRTPEQMFHFWVANLHLTPPGTNLNERELGPIRMDYFPQAGDLVEHAGYRLMIVSGEPDETAYWQQTNVWLGIVFHAVIAPEGDARPVVNVRETVPSEQPGAKALPDWPAEPPTGPVPHSWP
jgi:hypothetical protein